MPFTQLGLDRRLVDAVSALGYEKPTPIQSDAIPPALAGRDLLACAETGSGKSAAFLLPILDRLQGGRNGHVRALVLTPTRELAAQIDEARRDLGRNTRVTGTAVFGGVPIGPQERALRRGADILVATPGRLLDHLQNRNLSLDGVEIVVLDEADRMLDMGFLPDVKRILARLPGQRQTMLLSATIPPTISRLSREILSDPVTIRVQRQSGPAEGITQTAWPVAQELKTSLLLELLNRGELETALVFTRTKHRANRVADWLGKRGIAVARIHGNRSQKQRTEALAGFKKGRYRVLVATDVAARGIDIEALPHVVNFDVPAEPGSYIHRVGRTARAERTGDAWTFVSPHEVGDLRNIERVVGRKIEGRRLEGFDYQKRAEERLEIPIGQRIAEIRARKAEERRRSAEKKRQRTAPSQPSSNHRPNPRRPSPAKTESDPWYSSFRPRSERSPRGPGRRGRGLARPAANSRTR